MKTRERLALAWTPLCLRLALALTFVWAGAGKVVEFMEIDGEKAAVLANMGVTLSAPASKDGGGAGGAGGGGGGGGGGSPGTSAPNTPSGEPAPKPAGPDRPLPPPAEKPAPADGSGKATKREPQPSKKKPEASKGTGTTVPVARPRTATASAAGNATDADASTGTPLWPDEPMAAARAQPVPAPAPDARAGKVYVAADFPSPVRVRRVYGLALVMHAGATPASDTSGKPAMPLWPAQLATGSIPVYLAWAVALTELVGGAAIFFGLLTRLAALGQAGVMLGAIWLTQIGPAVQSGKALLGFLPSRPMFDVPSWMPLLWQFSLLMAALALLCAGPGVAAMDNLLFGGSGNGKAKPAGGGSGAAPPKGG